jgi:lysophospholipase L1-like esterase
MLHAQGVAVLINTNAAAALLALALVALAGPPPAQAQVQAQAAPPACTAPAEFAKFERPFAHLAGRIAQRSPVTVVAVGSSSTAGTGASSPAAAYPSRLEALLRAQFVGVPIRVLNRGVGGEEVRDMLARFDRDVIAAKPDLVLWQIGTNSVLHDHPFTGNAVMLTDGLSRLKAIGTELVLINPQYAPKVLAKPAVDNMDRLIAATAKQAGVELFDRFAVMKYWREGAKLPFTAFLNPDQLHMNDWGYNCIAELLSVAIADAVARAPKTAAAPIARK